MNIFLKALPVGSCLRLTPSQSPPDMNFHSADGNCLRPMPGRSPPIDTYLEFNRYYPENFYTKHPRYYPAGRAPMRATWESSS